MSTEYEQEIIGSIKNATAHCSLDGNNQRIEALQATVHTADTREPSVRNYEKIFRGPLETREELTTTRRCRSCASPIFSKFGQETMMILGFDGDEVSHCGAIADGSVVYEYRKAAASLIHSQAKQD